MHARAALSPFAVLPLQRKPSKSGIARRWAPALRAALMSLALGSLAVASGAEIEEDPPGRVGRLAETNGDVWLLEAGQTEWQSSLRNRPLTTGDRIATDDGARAVLQVGSTTVRLGEGSDLEIARLDDQRVELVLHEGHAALSVRETELVPEVEIATAEGRYFPLSVGHFRIDRSDSGSTAGVWAGELQFETDDSELRLRAGQQALFWRGTGTGADNTTATHYDWSNPTQDEFAQWAQAEEAQVTQLAANSAVSPEMTGAQDLDRYGTWDTHPEYGAIWAPTAVPAYWAPYRYGRWTWVGPWGWTWVDDAAWGYAPFHYGRWVNWRGRWCWAPGYYARRPVWGPAMVGWIGGRRGGVSVGIGFGPHVGWVPLAPREVYYPGYRYGPRYLARLNATHVRQVPSQRGPVMYRNHGVTGGITVVPASALAQRQYVAAVNRPADSLMRRALEAPQEPGDAPGAPQGANSGPRTARSINAVLADQRAARNMPDRMPPTLHAQRRAQARMVATAPQPLSRMRGGSPASEGGAAMPRHDGMPPSDKVPTRPPRAADGEPKSAMPLMPGQPRVPRPPRNGPRQDEPRLGPITTQPQPAERARASARGGAEGIAGPDTLRTVRRNTRRDPVVSAVPDAPQPRAAMPDDARAAPRMRTHDMRRDAAPAPSDAPRSAYREAREGYKAAPGYTNGPGRDGAGFRDAYRSGPGFRDGPGLREGPGGNGRHMGREANR